MEFEHNRWCSTARNYGIIHSPLNKYFVRDVLEIHFPLYQCGVSLATFKMYHFIIMSGDCLG